MRTDSKITLHKSDTVTVQPHDGGRLIWFGSFDGAVKVVLTAEQAEELRRQLREPKA